jgi:hypothetical protein
MTLEDRLTLTAGVLVLLLIVAINVWWLPQKWQGCRTLYANRPAQVVCLLSK